MILSLRAAIIVIRKSEDLDTAVKVKFGMLHEHIKRPGEYGYNQIVTQYFEAASDFFEAWGENLPSGLPNPVDEAVGFLVHKPFGTLYVDDEGLPVACVSVEDCSVEEALKNQRNR